MGVLSVIAAALAAWLFGAAWYGIMGRRWMGAAGLTEETLDRRNYAAFIGSLFAAVLVAGMMRHVFVTSGVDSPIEGALTGLGLGLFVASPWIATNYLFAQRPASLILIDGLYATGGCTLIGLVLALL
ncbi:DUF1761 domain-containing protein [Rhodosalinus halophilus]|uniref:DUF1761 domain-containing protein n=1 Tax=Rhodosalinus halophilus TaxID=2259333 RepID=A0A365U9C9_9RHOB|nr:DUF1761 domain-containing protein [Rhodosalinus halophilus]RBI84580.1 DUF1761 domain-containing protein [Rhodosalinus halophilus]